MSKQKPSASELAPVNWAGIEPHYRAGIRSIKAISAEFGVSRAAIDKHARKHGWTRDLLPSIKAKSDQQVARAAVAPAGCSPAATFSDQAIVDAGADQLTLVRLSHRADIAKARRLCQSLLAEVDVIQDRPELFAMVFDALDGADITETVNLERLARVVSDLPTRVKVLKDLAEAVGRLVSLEREAFGLNATPDGSDRPTAFIKDFTGRGDPDNLTRSPT